MSAPSVVQVPSACDERFRALVESVHDLVFVLDTAQRHVSVHGGVLRDAGLAPELFLGRTPRELLGEAAAPHEAANARALTGERVVYEWTSGNGPSRQYWQTSLAPMHGADGAIEGIVGVARDITAVRRSELALREVQRVEAVGRLAAGVAHDFNNALAAITGYAELVADSLPPSHPSQADLEALRAVAERTSSLTRQLLAFGRQQVLTPRDFDVATMVQGMAPMLRRLLPEHVQLRVRVPTAPWRVQADPAKIEQALLNLVLNARDAMAHGGRLTLLVANQMVDEAAAAQLPGLTAGPHVALVVSDTGEGIPLEMLPSIFEPFVTSKPMHLGTGLGLAMVHGVVQQSGGAMRVRSRPGHGARFTMLLPRAVHPVTPADTVAVVPLQASSPSASVAAEVLLVEDEPHVRTATRRLLERHGFRVREAADGTEALAAMREIGDAVDVLLTDVVMPGIGGPELAQRIRAGAWDPAIVFMSGYSNDPGFRRGEGHEGAEFLEKPFSGAHLVATLQRVIQQRGRAG